jgi:hypothetical protein
MLHRISRDTLYSFVDASKQKPEAVAGRIRAKKMIAKHFVGAIYYLLNNFPLQPIMLADEATLFYELELFMKGLC